MQDELRRSTDSRAPGEVNWSGVATPLPKSSVVYMVRRRVDATKLWTEIVTQEDLAEAQSNPELFELRTLFTVPVTDLARAPISHVARAQAALDQFERRTATLERRFEDRQHPQVLDWEGEADIFEMKAGANELQTTVERAQKSKLNFTQIRTADAAHAISYIKYLTHLAGTAQAARHSKSSIEKSGRS